MKNVPKKVFIRSFGCQMNKLDTALVSSALKQAGFKLVGGEEDADVVLINTCSVRDHAEQRVLSHLGHLKHIRQTRPQLVVGVIGCMAQRLGAELLGHPAVDIVCGPGQIPQITTLVTEALEQKKKQLSITTQIRRRTPQKQAQALDEFESVYDSDEEQLPSQTFVRVMHGCDNFCSYCVVPYVRGPEVSRSPTAIIEQVKRLTGEGVRVVTLLGQRVNAYKYNENEKIYCLADILEMVSKINGIEWIRFVTNYPDEEFLVRFSRQWLPCRRSANTCIYLHKAGRTRF